jgi:hypothetical protein
MRRQATIRSLMIAVAVCAGALALIRVQEVFVLVYLVLCLPLCTMTWQMLKPYRRLAGACFGLGFVLVHGVGLTRSISPPIMRIHTLAALLVAVPVVVGCGAAWATAVSRGGAFRSWCPYIAWALVVSLGAAPLAIGRSTWPLRLAFFASRPALERLAERVAAGDSIRAPAWAGVFHVVRSAFDSTTGTVALLVDDDPSRHSGLVHEGPRTPSPRRLRPLYNLSVDMHLDGRWWYREEE